MNRSLIVEENHMGRPRHTATTTTKQILFKQKWKEKSIQWYTTEQN